MNLRLATINVAQYHVLQSLWYGRQLQSLSTVQRLLGFTNDSAVTVIQSCSILHTPILDELSFLKLIYNSFTSSIALTSAPYLINSSATSSLFIQAAPCSGVISS